VASPTMSYLICSMALIVLILVIPSYFEIQRNSIADEMTRRELTEIADYTSNTLANLFFLAESAQSSDISLTKELLYLPLKVGDSFYVLNITRVDDDGDSLKVLAYITDQEWISGQSWIAPDLDVESESPLEIKSYELNSKIAVARCYGDPGNFYISLGYSEK
jgi:hypothetical protein